MKILNIGISKEVLDKLYEYPAKHITTPKLIEMGLFQSDGQACSRRKKKELPEFIHSGDRIYYITKSVIQWVKEELALSKLKDGYEKKIEHLENRIKGSKKPDSKDEHALTTSQTVKLPRWVDDIMRKEMTNGKGYGGNGGYGGWIRERVLDGIKFRKTVHPYLLFEPPAKSLSETKEKYLSVDYISYNHPTFSESFFKRNIEENPEFNKRVTHQIKDILFINVKALISFMSDVSKEKNGAFLV